MEKVTFTNGYGDSIVFTTDDPSVTYPYKMVAKTGFESADIQIQTSVAYGTNGTIYKNSTLGVRYLKIDFIFKESNVSDLADTRREIIQKLNPVIGEGQIQYIGENGDTYYINATVSDGPTVTAELPLATRMQVVFLCAQPFWESALGSATLTPGVALLLDTSSGDVEYPVLLEFTGPSTGDCSAILWVGSASRTITVTKTLLTNEKLLINTDPRNITVTFVTAGGVKSSAFNNIDVNSDFFQVQSDNSASSITMNTTGGTPTVKMYFRIRYLGV